MYVMYSTLLHLPPLRYGTTVSQDADIEPRTVVTLAITGRRSNNSARSYLLGYSPRSHSINPDLGHALQVWGSGSYFKTKPRTQVPNWPIFSVHHRVAARLLKQFLKNDLRYVIKKEYDPSEVKFCKSEQIFASKRSDTIFGWKNPDQWPDPDPNTAADKIWIQALPADWSPYDMPAWSSCKRMKTHDPGIR